MQTKSSIIWLLIISYAFEANIVLIFNTNIPGMHTRFIFLCSYEGNYPKRIQDYVLLLNSLSKQSSCGSSASGLLLCKQSIIIYGRVWDS